MFLSYNLCTFTETLSIKTKFLEPYILNRFNNDITNDTASFSMIASFVPLSVLEFAQKIKTKIRHFRQKSRIDFKMLVHKKMHCWG